MPRSTSGSAGVFTSASVRRSRASSWRRASMRYDAGGPIFSSWRSRGGRARSSSGGSRASGSPGTDGVPLGGAHASSLTAAHAGRGRRRLSGSQVLERDVLGVLDEHASRLRAFVARDDPAPLQHVDQAPGTRVAHSEPPLDQGHGRSLRLDDDLDRLLEQWILVRVELALGRVHIFSEDLGQLEQRLVELLLALLAALADDERDLFLGDVRALHTLQARGPERLEQHVALAQQALRAGLVEDDS